MLLKGYQFKLIEIDGKPTVKVQNGCDILWVTSENFKKCLQ